MGFRRLVPLRIPSGWAVEFNNFVETGAPASLSARDRDTYLGQDLLAIRSIAPAAWHTSGYALFVGWFPERDPRGAYSLRVGRQGVAGTDIELTNAHAEVVRDAIELCLNRLNGGASPAEIQRLLADATATGGASVP